MSARGMTLLEVMVVLAIVGTMSAVVSLAIGDHRRVRTLADDVTALRSDALRHAATRRTVVKRDGHVYVVTALPDGSLVADSALGIDRHSGRVGRP